MERNTVRRLSQEIYSTKISRRIRVLLIAVTIASSLVFAQRRIEYFRSYDDFIKNRNTPIAELKTPPFFRATFNGVKAEELWEIDSSGTVRNRTLFKYNPQGNLSELLTYNGKNQLTVRRSYTPDSLQLQVLQKVQGVDWIPHNEAFYTETLYDSLVRPIIHRIFAFQGNLVGVITQEYGDFGQLVREAYYAGNQANLLEYSEFSFSVADSIQVIKQYDGQGNLKSHVRLKIYK